MFCALPVKATIKQTCVLQNGKSCPRRYCVKKTLERSSLWEVQTPQVFKTDALIEAYRRFRDVDVTDDAMLLEKLGRRVSIVMGREENIKLTTPYDLMIAQAIAKSKSRGKARMVL